MTNQCRSCDPRPETRDPAREIKARSAAMRYPDHGHVDVDDVCAIDLEGLLCCLGHMQRQGERVVTPCHVESHRQAIRLTDDQVILHLTPSLHGRLDHCPAAVFQKSSHAPTTMTLFPLDVKQVGRSGYGPSIQPIT